MDAHEIWGAIKKTFFRIDDKFVEKAYLEVQKYRESKKLDLMKNLNVLPVSESESEKSEITQKTENKTEIK